MNPKKHRTDLDNRRFASLAALAREIPETKIRTAQAQKNFAIKTLRALFEIVRVLEVRCTLEHGQRLFPAPYGELLAEILHEPPTDRDNPLTSKALREYHSFSLLTIILLGLQSRTLYA